MTATEVYQAIAREGVTDATRQGFFGLPVASQAGLLASLQQDYPEHAKALTGDLPIHTSQPATDEQPSDLFIAGEEGKPVDANIDTKPAIVPKKAVKPEKKVAKKAVPRTTKAGAQAKAKKVKK